MKTSRDYFSQIFYSQWKQPIWRIYAVPNWDQKPNITNDLKIIYTKVKPSKTNGIFLRGVYEWLRIGISSLVLIMRWNYKINLSGAALMLCPRYRTFSGFLSLLQKDWLSMGHKCADRLKLSQENPTNGEYFLFSSW